MNRTERKAQRRATMGTGERRVRRGVQIFAAVVVVICLVVVIALLSALR